MQRTPVLVLMLVLVGGAAFYGGMRYERSRGARASIRGEAQNIRAPRERQQRGIQLDGGGFSGGRTGGRQSDVAAGEIIAKDATSVTVKLRDGGTKIILLSNATEVSKTVEGGASDLVVGAMVFVNGSANTDGSVTAQSIQIRPREAEQPAS